MGELKKPLWTGTVYFKPGIDEETAADIMRRVSDEPVVFSTTMVDTSEGERKEQIENKRLRAFLRDLRERTPYGLYREQITDVLGDRPVPSGKYGRVTMEHPFAHVLEVFVNGSMFK